MNIDDQTRVLIGQSARTRQLLRLIEKLGPAQWPVLLMGETGTGKEVVARRLHAARGAGPFVTIDCSAMVGPLMESELFGHAKGAFTGAQANKLGLVEAAHGGTAFFDEIGELPLDLQAKLLRLLQEKEYRPVGSVSARKADFRVVAATNRDLLELVKERSFREDLYYRLAMVQFRVPPLRERMEDFPLLLHHFLQTYAAQYAKPGLTIHPRAERALRRHTWPGNIRELQNVLGYACMMAQHSAVDLADFPEWWIASLSGRSAPTAPRALQSLEYQHIQQVLKECGGNRTRAAKVLGIGRATLYRALAKPPASGQQLSLREEVAG